MRRQRFSAVTIDMVYLKGSFFEHIVSAVTE